jgi:hypothetical protein
MTTTLLDHLQEQGYEPQEDGDWFDLIASGIGSIRVGLDDGTVDIYAFDGYMACEWQVSLSAGTPESVIIRTVEAAEWWLAGKRHGPVTPAQAATAR